MTPQAESFNPLTGSPLWAITLEALAWIESCIHGGKPMASSW